MNFVWIVVTGGLGVAARWGLGVLLGTTLFPWATLAVNAFGGLAMGLLQGSGLSPEWRVRIAVGFLGGFTTFSAFTWDTLRLWQAGENLLSLANILVNNFIAIALCALGYWLGAGVIAR